MAERPLERIIKQNPDFEQRYGSIRSFVEKMEVIFVGKHFPGETAPYTAEEMGDLKGALRGIGLGKGEIVGRAYKAALAEDNNPISAWTKAAHALSREYLVKVGRAEDEVIRRRLDRAIETFPIFMGDGFSDTFFSLQFRVEKGTIVFGGKEISIQGMCPFAAISLGILGTAFEVMGREKRLPPLKFALRDPYPSN